MIKKFGFVFLVDIFCELIEFEGRSGSFTLLEYYF